MTRVDDIIEAIDAGLQTPHPDPTFGEVSPPNHDRCARCEHHNPAEGGELCDGCRAFLLGDSDTDPTDVSPRAVPRSYAEVTVTVDESQLARIAQRFADRVAEGAIRHDQVDPDPFSTHDQWAGFGQRIADEQLALHDACAANGHRGWIGVPLDARVGDRVGRCECWAYDYIITSASWDDANWRVEYERQPAGQRVWQEAAREADYWNDRCLVCGETPVWAHRCEPRAEPLGFLAPPEPVDRQAAHREQARAREQVLLDQRRRSQRRTNRWGRP